MLLQLKALESEIRKMEKKTNSNSEESKSEILAKKTAKLLYSKPGWWHNNRMMLSIDYILTAFQSSSHDIKRDYLLNCVMLIGNIQLGFGHAFYVNQVAHHLNELS